VIVSVRADRGYSSGTHYFEMNVDSRGFDRHPYLGIVDENFEIRSGYAMWTSRFSNNYTYGSTGSIWHKGSRLVGGLDTYGNGDRIGILVNIDKGVISFYKNKELQKTLHAPSITTERTIFPAAGLFGPKHKITLLVAPQLPVLIPNFDSQEDPQVLLDQS